MKSPLFENKVLQQIWASSSDSILITNKDAEIVYVNPAWQKLSGYPYSEVVGKNPRFLQSGKTPKYVYRKMWKTLSNGKAFNSEEVINKKKMDMSTELTAVFIQFLITVRSSIMYNDSVILLHKNG